MQIYRISNSSPQVYRISKTIPTHTTTRNMAFFPRFVAHEFAPMFSKQESNLFRLLDDYSSLMANRGSVCAPAFTQSMRTFQPRFDMKESKDTYELHGELPGIAQKDINIEFTDANTLSIRGRTETVREEGRNPNAAIEAQPEQQKLTDEAETESIGSSTNYHKASVEDEAAASATESNASPIETPAASEAPTTQAQEVATQNQQADSTNYWFSERSVGSFARSFSFPQRVDQEAVKASLKDGILSIVIPKAPAPENRRIEIQ
ncbi:hypothetical protein Q7P37_004943 [Cladosporium fusiforme]